MPHQTWLAGLHQKGILCSCLPPHGLSVVLLTTKGLLIESSRQYLCSAGAQMLWAFGSMLLANGPNGEEYVCSLNEKQAFRCIWVHHSFVFSSCKRQNMNTAVRQPGRSGSVSRGMSCIECEAKLESYRRMDYCCRLHLSFPVCQLRCNRHSCRVVLWSCTEACNVSAHPLNSVKMVAVAEFGGFNAKILIL